MIEALFRVAFLLLDVLWWVIIAQVVLSWLFVFNVLNTSSSGVRAFAQALDRILAPIYRPIRAILPDFGGLDFSPFVVLILIQVADILLAGAETSLLQSSGQ